jgi:branched-chain amino acid aminotransferase
MGRGLLPPDEHPAPTIVVQAWPVLAPPDAHLRDGLHLVASSVRRDPENPLSALKTTSRADYVYARIEARAAGADDALFLTIDGYLSEATSANLFVIRATAGTGAAAGGTGAPAELATPSLACAILPGTTRDWILRWGGEAGLRPLEGLLTTRDLHEADEAFLSSSVAGILPVTRFAGEPIGSGRPGPWTLRARADREAFIRGPG